MPTMSGSRTLWEIAGEWSQARSTEPFPPSHKQLFLQLLSYVWLGLFETPSGKTSDLWIEAPATAPESGSYPDGRRARATRRIWVGRRELLRMMPRNLSWLELPTKTRLGDESEPWPELKAEVRLAHMADPDGPREKRSS